MSTRLEHYKRGMALFGENKFSEAIEAYRAALVEDPDWTDGLHGLAMAQMHAGQLDEAIATGKRIVELDADDAFAHTSLSMFYQRKNMIEEAEREAAKARMISWKEELKKNPNAAPPGPAGSMDVIQ
ncbi:MAG: tetratricopeptide repeat protein [Planctomycetes bacterium]|nr:tetratricopeptide repeat protein [Planctomycetota bacterium]